MTKKLWFRALLLPLLVLLLVLPLMAFGVSPVLYFEGLTYDFRVAAMCQQECSHNPIGLIVKDDNSDEEVDLPFWPRELYQGVLDNVGELGCDVIGLDILFEDRGGTSIKSQEADTQLARSLSSGPSSILASRVFVNEDKDFGLIHRYRGPLPIFGNAALSEGFINVNAEMGVVRSIALYRPHPAWGDERVLPSFALAIYLTRLVSDSWSACSVAKRSEILKDLAAGLEPLLKEVRQFAGAREGKNFFLEFDFGSSPSFRQLKSSLLRIEKSKRKTFADENIETIAQEIALRFVLRKLEGSLELPRRFADDEAFTIPALLQNHRLVKTLALLVGPLLPLDSNSYSLRGPILNVDFSGFASTSLLPLVEVADKTRLFQNHLNPSFTIRNGEKREFRVKEALPPGRCTLVGRVADVDGKAISGAVVFFVVPDDRFGRTVSADDGSFVINGLNRGVGLISISHENVAYEGTIEVTGNSSFSFLWPTLSKSCTVKGLAPREDVHLKSLFVNPQWTSQGSDGFKFPTCGTKLTFSLSARQGETVLASIRPSFPLELLDNKESLKSSLSIANLRYGKDETTVLGTPQLSRKSDGIRFYIDVEAKGGQWSYLAQAKTDDQGVVTFSNLPLGSYEIWRGEGEAPLEQCRLQLKRNEPPPQILASELPRGQLSGRNEPTILSLLIDGRDEGENKASFISLPKGNEISLEKKNGVFLSRKIEGKGFVVLHRKERHCVAKAANRYSGPKTYMLGTMVQSDQDFYATPVNSLAERPLAGVEIHGAAIRTLMNGTWIERAPSPFWELLIVFPYIVVAVGLCTLSLESSVFLWAFVTLGYLGLTFLAMGSRIWLPFAAPMLLLILCPGTFLVFRVYEERKEAARRKSIFQKFINPQVVEQLLQLEEVALHGERKDLTIMFSDIRGFTTISEKNSPQDVTGMLNEYFNRMLPILHKYEGTLDKFIGDAIMAFYGAPIDQPNHARRAVVTAIEMIHETRKLAKEREREGSWPPFKIGFGIASGPCQVGLIGSDEVFNYSVIGDTVNLAARLEGLNKTYNAEILVSEKTWLLVEDLVEGCFIDEVAVKGKNEKVKVYQIIDFKGGRLDPFLV